MSELTRTTSVKPTNTVDTSSQETTQKSTIKRTSSPPKQVSSPQKVREQELKIDQSITNDSLDPSMKAFVNTMKPAMDDANRVAADIWTTQGSKAMLSHIMTNPDGTPMSYAESRYLYG